MIEAYRREFNRNYTEEKYQRVLRSIEELAGGKIPFRIAESPIFIPANLLLEMQQASVEIVGQLCENRDYFADAQKMIPGHYIFPREDERSLFMLFDYAIARRPDGVIKPMITEIQGFPSLFAFQYYLSKIFQEGYRLAPELKFLCDDLDDEAFRRIFRKAILNDHDPENVALVDVRPLEQSTLSDFQLTQRLCPGMAIVCATELRKRDRRLYYLKEGKEIPVKRIYHRVVWEELSDFEKDMNFSFQEELDVEWAGHPNWFFKYSKLSLPYLRHPNVPRTYFLDELTEFPADLENFILKPLFSFSGRGLILDLEAAALDRIPAAERKNYILQEKIHYAEAIQAIEGTVRCEIRLMYIWLDQMTCVMTLPRMSRGRMMGCAYNQSEPWTGHGVGFFPISDFRLQIADC